MTRHLIVAQFHEYAAAHRALCELIQTGIRPDRVSIVAGDRSNSHGANRDFGILDEDADTYIAAVRRGATLLAVDADDAGPARVTEIIEHHAPSDIAEPGSVSAAAEEARGRERKATS
jgi:hypothetical protein